VDSNSVPIDQNAGPLGQRTRNPKPAPVLREVLGAVLRRTRLMQQRTLADVARQAQVSTPYLSEIERGRKEASSEVLTAVCGALDLPLVDLLGLTYRALRTEQPRTLTVVRGDVQAPSSAAAPGRISSRFDPHGSPVALAA